MAESGAGGTAGPPPSLGQHGSEPSSRPSTGSTGDGADTGDAAGLGDTARRSAPKPARNSRAGRDLPAAIGVGVILGAFILVPLFTLRAIFVGVVSVAVAMGTYEVVRAVRLTGVGVPLLPLVVGAAAMPVAAYTEGTSGLVLALAATVGASALVRVWGSPVGLVRDLGGAAFVAGYVGFPAGFAALLTEPSDGHWRVIAFLGTVVASDIGGYTAGVLSGGRHKMAPSVSPGKSWEGFAGSATACVIVASVLLAGPLGAEVWQGILLGLAVAATATVGDLGESLLKRDIGIKDMSSLLPGHGGLMDRLDSLLCTAPVAWLLISAFLD